jgi:hypothetical protein
LAEDKQRVGSRCDGETEKEHAFDPADRIDAHDPVSGEFESGR